MQGQNSHRVPGATVRYSRVPRGWGATGAQATAQSSARIRRAVRTLAASVVMAVATVFIGVATGLVRAPSPPLPPPASPAGEVLSYATTWRGPALDPLITLPSGVQVKSSNYRGVVIDGVTYYYNLAPHASYDPLARGVMSIDQVQIVAVVGDPPDRVLIYTRKPTPGRQATG